MAVERGQRCIGPLSSHAISASSIWWRNRRLVTRIRHVWCANLRAAMVRPRGREWRLWRVSRRHCSARDERLRLGIKTLVPIIASRYRMLALRIIGVRVRW